jgi:hypothetical protein
MSANDYFNYWWGPLTGIPRVARLDIYKIKNGFPLEGESHERFIATKVPKRKNKDYRARFSRFSFGFPVYNIY